MLYFINLSDSESCAPDSKVVYLCDEVEKVKRLLCTHDYQSYVANEAITAILSKVLGKAIPASEKPATADDVNKMLRENAYIVMVSAKQIEDVVSIEMIIVKPRNKIAML